jgi:nickel-dependent lactate racemase
LERSDCGQNQCTIPAFAYKDRQTPQEEQGNIRKRLKQEMMQKKLKEILEKRKRKK